jgi:type I restriction enzyme M protein
LRPLKDERPGHEGKPLTDVALRDTENLPLGEDIKTYFKREVLPHAPDAWIDDSKTKVGYEIPFNRHFYVFEPPRPLAAIDADFKRSTDKILAIIKGVTAQGLHSAQHQAPHQASHQARHLARL